VRIFQAVHLLLTDGLPPAVQTGEFLPVNGHPAPSAQFQDAPYATNYTITLTSKLITSIHSPIMRLKYDIYLNNFGTTALNQMAVEIWDGTVWHLLKNYDNSTGADIPWTSEDIDVSAYANIDFKIRFRAYGEDSSYIDWWNIDNILVYGLLPPGPDPCLLGYNLYLNTQLETNTTDTSYLIPPGHVQYVQPIMLVYWRSTHLGIQEHPVMTLFPNSSVLRLH